MRYILWLLLISLTLVATYACNLQVGVAAEVSASKAKATIVNEIVMQLEHWYASDPSFQGRTITVIIKDFSLNDEETYAIIEDINAFWIVSLPAERRKLFGTEDVCVCRALNFDKVERTLAEDIRRNGIVRKFIP